MRVGEPDCPSRCAPFVAAGDELRVCESDLSPQVRARVVASFAGADLGYGRDFQTYAVATALPDLIMPLPAGAVPALPRFITDEDSPPGVALPGTFLPAKDLSPDDSASAGPGEPSSRSPALGSSDLPPVARSDGAPPVDAESPETPPVVVAHAEGSSAGEDIVSAPVQSSPGPLAPESGQPPHAPDIAAPTSGPSSPDFVPLPDPRTLRVR